MVTRLQETRTGIMKHKEEWSLLAFGIGCHVAGIFCLRLAGDWYEDSEYTSREVCGFVFGTIFLSLSIPSIIAALKSVFWMKYAVITIVWIYLLFTILALLGFVLSLFTFHGYVYFVWNESSELSPVITLTSLISMSLCLLFSIVSAMHLYRTFATRKVRGKFSKRMSHFDVPDGGAFSTETTALLEEHQLTVPDDGDKEQTQLTAVRSNITAQPASSSAASAVNHQAEKPEATDELLNAALLSTTSNSDSAGDSAGDYIPTSYKSDMACYRGDSAFCIFVWLVLPALFVMCTLLPSNFALFLPSNIAQITDEGTNTYEIRLFWYSPHGGPGFNLYPDLIIFYSVLFFVCNVSYLSRKSLWFRIEMRKIRFFIPRGGADGGCCGFFGRAQQQRRSVYIKRNVIVKQGEWLLWSIFFLFFVTWAIYWICLYDGYDNVLSTYKWLQRTALGVGKCAMLALSLSLFTVTRNANIWTTVFHTSYEHMMRFHKFFSYLFMGLSCLHLLLWLVYFGVSGMLGSNIMFAAIPYTYAHKDFTVPSMYYLFVLVLIPAYFLLSSVMVRITKYELFYYSHLVVAVITVSMVVWHAKAAWYYVIPPVILYVVDQLMLMWKSTRIAHITDIAVLDDPRFVQLTVSIDEIFKSEVYEASIDVYNSSLALNDKKLFNFGQFFWINIPSISKYEWHPMCVSNSSLAKHECEFTIVRPPTQMKEESAPKEWSERVVALGQTDDGGADGRRQVLNRMMEIKLDGPYGDPIVVDAYRKILIVVGGVGFVSYIRFFEYMLYRATRDETQISVDLVWLCKSPQIYLPFKSILREYAARFDNDPERLFDVRLFYTERVKPSVQSEIESSLQLTLEYGRPNLMKELSYIEGLGTFTLIMGSGPPGLLQMIQRVAVRFGAHYREEKFVL